MNTTECLTIACAIVPDRTAFVFEGLRFSYLEFQERVNRLANALSDLGASPGDRIATMQVSTVQLVEAYFASARLDAIFVPFNFRARGDELANMLTISKPSVLLVGERYSDLVESVIADVPPPRHLVSLDGSPGDGFL